MNWSEADVIMIEIKYTINTIHLNHPSSIPLPSPWKNCLPWNQSLVPKRLGTADLEDRFKEWKRSSRSCGWLLLFYLWGNFVSGLQYCTFAWWQHLLNWWFSYFSPPVTPKGNVLNLNLIISCNSFLYPIIPPDFLASVVNRSLPLRSILSFFLDTCVTPEHQLESVFLSLLVTLWSKLNSYQWNELEW